MGQTLTVSGLDVRYIDVGPREADAQILLLFHGWGADAGTFVPVVDALKEQYRVIAPDLPGCGATGEPEKPWTNNDYADFIQAFIEGLGLKGQRLSACGHSHGGRILIKWAARSPLELRRLILIDSAGLKPRRGLDWYARVYAYKAGKTLLKLPYLGRRLAPLAAAKQESAGSADYRQASPLMRRTMAMLLEEDLGRCLPMIRVPTLLFWGEQDEDTPIEMGRKMEKDIPNAGLVLLSPAGHYAYLDQLPIFLRALCYFMEHS